ncbi:Chain length determinant protein [Acididesulfobacillus acetoxydans]|uniref:Capsular polysaccharide biosynthesis protein n=1 Tax=Acididesulfobacillus acetoxydans TaxID=1561005 RepID=A0A8S0X1I8_9FIRM|nr:Wzz/FepE/Etk N-terminal domain-containing protein [Acididesulfobacillus acetoxydans]CAA7603171.1 Chain length determinant protein [Acididesulfobacillus acetoxydans]CEJ07601.1 Capsular polysaccharide biosynthesis protein [Acididesulfobacillus acetoxydans]
MQEEELDLRQYWEVLRKHWLIVVAIPLIAALTSGIVSFFVLKPVYESVTTLIVGQKATAADSVDQAGKLLDYNALLADQQLAKTYATIAKSRTVEENVIKTLGLSQTFDTLNKSITVDSVPNTEVLEIKVDNTSPALAAQIANATAKEFSGAVIKIKKVDSVSVVDKAVAPHHPIKPKKSLNVMIAFVVGLMVAVGIAFLIEYLDNTIKTSDDVGKILGLPVLGVIPDFKLEERE